MVAFLMLGIIPGTNIQISFNDWLQFVQVLSILLIIISLVRRRRIAALLILLAIRHAVRTAKQTPQLA